MPQTNTHAEENTGVMQMTLHLQYIKDLSFEVPLGAQIFTNLTSAPNINVDLDLQTNLLHPEQHTYEIIMKIHLQAYDTSSKNDQNTPDANDGRIVFIAELAYAAVVSLINPQPNITEGTLMVEVPRLIFPYARSIISNITREGGFPPVVLQPIDFLAMWESKRDQIAAQTQNVNVAGHA